MQVASIIREEANPEKIILFGSYAKGNYVEDRYVEKGTMYEYISDYDFLIITKDNPEKESKILDRISNRCRHLFKTPVNVILHDLDYVNEGLEIGQYFFTEIAKEGILLYDKNALPFSKPRELTRLEMKEIAQRYFNIWYSTASNFTDFAAVAFEKLLSENQSLNDGAFLLHQAAERLYNTLLLVFTGYKPKTHNLEKLRQYAKHISEEIFAIFPFNVDDKFEWNLFDLLKRGYIDARYKADYVITENEYRVILERLQKMRDIVKRICREKINSFS